ncbi:hypothetical protein [Streptomyces sp. JH34]|uniref:hypothetical protein n=1 Tax=Streptomyces sp. JH34 TaxID=2793633 RepID=UPI0023F8378E|nr:hypothetical protein [Streptomyces sp. JH34]MDF6021271.1 hypothetical protein [Streptomyces sp. JH34]
MNVRVLRTELRRSVAPWAGVAVLTTGLLFLLLVLGPGESTADWTVQWTPMALTVRGLLYYLWPVAVGLGALQGLRDPRSRVTELMATVPRPAWQRVAVPSAASAVTLTSAFLVIVATGGTWVLLGDTTYMPLGWLPIVLVAALALVAGTLFGMGVARALPSVLTPPLMAVAALVMTVLLQQFADEALPTGNAPNLLAQLVPGVALPREELLTLAPSVHLGQTVWFSGMLATGFALLAAASARARLLALAPVLGSAALALLILPVEPRDTYVIDKAAAELVCDGPVCVTEMHRDRLAALAPHGKEALRVLQEVLGEDAPDVVREETALRGPMGKRELSDEAVLIDLDDPVIVRAEGEQLTRALVGQGLAPHCTERSSWINGIGLDEISQSVGAGWALGDFRLIDWAGHFDGPEHREAGEAAWGRLTALPPAEQRAWIGDTRTAALACDVRDARGVLTGEAF